MRNDNDEVCGDEENLFYTTSHRQDELPRYTTITKTACFCSHSSAAAPQSSTRFPTRFPLNAFNLPRPDDPVSLRPLSPLHATETTRPLTNNTPSSAVTPSLSTRLFAACTSLVRPIGKSEILIISALTPHTYRWIRPTPSLVQDRENKISIGFFPL